MRKPLARSQSGGATSLPLGVGAVDLLRQVVKASTARRPLGADPVRVAGKEL